MFVSTIPTRPNRQTLVANYLVLMFFLLVAYAVVFDQGALGGLISDRLLDSGGVLHEFFHDGRHVLGVPCH